MDKKKVLQTRNVQASFLDAMRETTWNLRVMEHWLEGDKDNGLVEKLDKVAEVLYDAYHYVGTTRPDRRDEIEEARKKLAAHFGGNDGKSDLESPLQGV